MRLAVLNGLRTCSTLAVITHLLVHQVSSNALRPISVTFGQGFLGYDGQWSSAQIRVGKPEQWLSVIPSTTESEARVVGQAGCDGTSTCSSLRGGLFSLDQSTTWQELGPYELGYSALSLNTDTGNYGLDTLSLSDNISTANQVIAIVNDTDHWLGQLGLGVQNTRFQNNTNFLPFISTLVQTNSLVPSHSYGYTAGASYKGQGVPGSLTIGGTDTIRYVPNTARFLLAPGYIPSLAVTSLTVSASSAPGRWTANPLTLLSSQQAAVFTIDSNTPFLWFPQSVCDNIADALDLTWNSTIELYTFANASSPQTLSQRNLQFTFVVASGIDSNQTIALNVSFNAFNLQLSYPFPGLFSSYSDAKVNYFPLRRANSSNQYTIGRSFLQETYLTVDYERNVFSLSQALFPDTSQQPALSPITRPKDSTWPGPQHADSTSTLTVGAVAGIVTGSVILLTAVGLLIWRLCTRRKVIEQLEDGEKRPRTGFRSILSKLSTRRSSTSTIVAELLADKHHPTEMVSDSSNSRYELASVAPVEMAAADVSHAYFQPRVHAHIPQLNDPRSPIELPNPRRQTSTDKQELEHTVESPGSPAPAYSVLDSVDRSNSISPYTTVGPSVFNDGSDIAVSPLKSNGDSQSRDNNRLQP